MRTCLASLLLAILVSAGGVSAGDVIGRAMLPAGSMPPENAVFTAVLVDISLADAPAVVIAEETREPAGQPPYSFVLEFQDEDIKDRHRYAVRATLRAPDGALLFTTDTVHPVITNGTMEHDVEMIAVRRDEPEPSPVSAFGLQMPGTFLGTLPCADCEGIAHTLNVWPNGGFHMVRTWRGRDGALPEFTVGTWYADPTTEAIILDMGYGDTMGFEATAPDTVRLLAQDGSRIESDLNYELTVTQPMRDVDLEDVFLNGMVENRDGVTFMTECLSGRSYPVTGQIEGPAVREASASRSTPVYAEVIGTTGMFPEFADRFGRSLRVDEFIRLRPGVTCERQRASASLFNTYWRIDRLKDASAATDIGRREAHVVFRSGETPGYRATVGCNQVAGGAESSGTALRLSGGAMTKMACPPPLDQLERLMNEVFAETRSYRTRGETMILRNETGGTIAVLTAVYLQ